MSNGVTKWLLKKFSGINRDRMNKHIEIMHKNTGKSKPYIYCSLIWSFITRGTGYTDFFRGNFLEISSKEKDTFVTAKSFYNILSYLNDKNYASVINDKLIFNEMFRDYLGREFINLRISSKNEFRQFLDGKDVVFAKDPTGYGGHGVSKIVLSEVDDIDALYDRLIEKGQPLVEQAIVQSDDVNAINPCVVNSFRIVTLYKDGEAYIINNAMRVNQDNTSVIGCTNDLYFSLGKDGKIDSNVIDDYGNIYDIHPMTGTRFSDIKISGVGQAFDMCKTAAKKIPQIRYIGWDVAFSVNGPVFVEGNEYPGYGILQHFRLKNKKTGHLKEIADVLGDEMKNIKL